MSTHIDTIIGNKELSEKLTGMLVDLRSKVGLVLEDVENDIEKIRAQGHSEGFEDHEIDLLLKMFERT